MFMWPLRPLILANGGEDFAGWFSSSAGQLRPAVPNLFLPARPHLKAASVGTDLHAPHITAVGYHVEGVYWARMMKHTKLLDKQ